MRGGGGCDDRPGELAAEALRLHDRYLHEVVLSFGLCPWAEKSVREGHFRRVVLGGETPDAAAILPFVDSLDAEPAPVDVAFAIFPALTLSSAGFDKFTEQLRRADRARRPATASTPFFMAAFHPFGASTYADANQLIAFARRCPDPTVQLVRASVLDQVRASGVDISGSIARQNFATVSGQRSDALPAVLEDLRRDRDESYRRFAQPR